ncbi:arylamine N-acetyltransferase [Streptomyces sp. A1-5]|nr:arylamine N-acetyltransferase [Streptomyces sp. A1-5]
MLRALHAAHIVSLTFEDLEVVLGRPIRLDLGSLQTTMVRRRRGGTCREQILLCAAALDAVGFTFTAAASRVRLGEDRIRPATHMSLRVDVGGEGRFTNVGFGAESLLEPLRLRDGEVARQAGGPLALPRQAVGAKAGGRPAAGPAQHGRPLQRYTGRRETYGETQAAITSLVSDRSARRPTRRRISTALVPFRTTTSSNTSGSSPMPWITWSGSVVILFATVSRSVATNPTGELPATLARHRSGA